MKDVPVRRGSARGRMRELSRWAQGMGMPASYAAYLGVHGMSTGLHKAGTLKQTNAETNSIPHLALF